jgi:RHS repeat-associated protein
MTAHFTGTSGTPDSTTSYYTSTSLSAGMGGQFEVKDGATKKYYSIAGMMVAVNDGTGLQYLLTDHLGSTVAVTNSSGTLTSQQRYLPFGAPRTIPNSPILGTDFTYTGQRKLDDGMGGIMDYKARFYSPYLNRFLQPDTIIPNAANPQAYNRFSYVFNRPINLNDPSGHDPDSPPDPRAYDDCWTYLGTDEFGNDIYGRNAWCQEYEFEEDHQITFISILKSELTLVEVQPGLPILMVSSSSEEEEEEDVSVTGSVSGRTPNSPLPKLPDDALVCRGGQCKAEQFKNGKGVIKNSDGTLSNVSVNSDPRVTLDDLASDVPHKQVGVTTVGEIRLAGGDVIPTPLTNNPYHADVNGLTAMQLEELFTPTVMNPKYIIPK